MMLTNRILIAACLSEVVAQVNSTTPVVPAFLVPLGLAAYTLPLCTNVIVTALIAGRIWYMMREIRDADMPTKTGRAAIDIIVESGMLYLAIQLVYVTLFALRLPAQTIASHMAVQIYVRILHQRNCIESDTHQSHRALHRH